MFEEIAESGPTATDRFRSGVAAVLRSRPGRSALGLLVLLFALVNLGASTGVWLARPTVCVDLPQAEFTIEELIETKDKVLDYEREPEGELTLSGKEASFVLADNLKYPVWIETRANELYVQAELPEQDRCFHVEFQGTVVVEKGRVLAVPTALWVGGMNLGPLVGGRAFQVKPDDLHSEEASKLLGQTRSLRVDKDLIYVAVDNPRSLR